MKRISSLLLLLAAVVSLAACNSEGVSNEPEDDTTADKPVVEKPEVDKPADKEPVKEEPQKEEVPAEKPANDDAAQKDTQQGTVEQKPAAEKPVITEDKPVLTGDKSKVYRNEVFKDVVVEDADDNISVKGKAQVFEGVFEYTVYEGGKVLKEDSYQTEGAPAWGDFTITFGKDLMSGNDATVELYVLSAKDSSKTHALNIPIKK